MPYKERTNFKRYWTIGEIAEDMNVKSHIVRFYCAKLKIKENKRNIQGYRLFNQRKYSHLIMLIALMKSKRYTLYGAMQNLREYKEAKKNIS